jgi:hypothetical protein
LGVLVARLIASLTLVAALFAGGASAGTLPPTKLYRALLSKPIAASQAPDGLLPAPPTDPGRTPTMAKYPAARAVIVRFEPTELPKFLPPADVVLYEIYPSHRDAVAESRAANASRPNVTGTSKAPSWLPTPSAIVNASSGVNKSTADGITDVSFVDGDVAVDATTISATSTKHGNLAVSLALARLALRHLEAVRAGRS